MQGLPVAIAAAVPLWAATMAGGLVDSLRGAQAELQVSVVEGKSSPLGVPFSILASCIFLATGGPSRIAGALASGALPAHPVLAAAHDLAGGIGIARHLAELVPNGFADKIEGLFLGRESLDAHGTA